jgi:DNA-binding response OmpR family regulator
MRKLVLVVAQQTELRAKIACLLQSVGYAVELAESRKRALELATGEEMEAAIVVHSTDLAGLGRELRDRLPRTIVLGQDELVRPGYLLRGSEAFPLQALDEQKLLDRLGRLTASTGSAGDETAPAPVILRIEDCKLDLASRSFVDGNGREVRLTRAENALLAAFVGSPRRVLSRDQLRHAIVGRGTEPHDRSVDMLVARVRRKIERDPKAPRFILSVPGVGYKFTAQPEGAEDGKSLTAIGLVQFKRSGLGETSPISAPAQGIAARHSEPEKRQLTVLSCRLVGSMAIALDLDPEDLGSTFHRFQDICTTVITCWGGAVTNSAGDEILALFGYPKGHEDDAERAVHAGLELVANAGKLLSPSGEPLQVRIAIATGLDRMSFPL